MLAPSSKHPRDKVQFHRSFCLLLPPYLTLFCLFTSPFSTYHLYSSLLLVFLILFVLHLNSSCPFSPLRSSSFPPFLFFDIPLISLLPLAPHSFRPSSSLPLLFLKRLLLLYLFLCALLPPGSALSMGAIERARPRPSWASVTRQQLSWRGIAAARAGRPPVALL